MQKPWNGIRVFASEADAKTLVELSRWVGKRGDGVIWNLRLRARGAKRERLG